MSANAAQSTTTKAQPKVLRIGLAQDGKIVQERLIKAGESVFIGKGPKNTFEVTGPSIPERFELFAARGPNYSLMVQEWVEGKISSKEGIRDLEEVRKGNDTPKKGDSWSVALHEDVRGKVVIGNTTILFQFVSAPPEPMKAVTAADFRPRFFDEDDPLFLSLLTVLSVIAGVFIIWVRLSPPPIEDEMAQIKRATQLVTDVIKLDEIPLTQEDGNKPEKKPENKPSTEKPANNQPQANAPKDPSQSIAQRSLLIQQIGSMEGSMGSFVDSLGTGDAAVADLNSALAGVSGTQQASAGNLGARQGSGNGLEDARVAVGSTFGGGAGTGTGTGAGTVQVKARVQTEAQDVDVEEGDANGVGDTIRRYSAKIQTCTEQSLKANPTLKGRISATWQIAAGKVQGVSITTNSTNDAALGECVARSIRGMRFDAGVTATVDQYTWVVSAAQ